MEPGGKEPGGKELGGGKEWAQPGWERSRRGSLQSDRVRVDPAADWWFSDAAERRSGPAPVLIGLRRGVRPRMLAAPPKPAGGEPIGVKEWRESLILAPAFLEGPVDDPLQRIGYCTGHATRRFFQWLVDNPDVQALVSSVTLSGGPPPAAKRAAPAAGAGAPARRARAVLGVIDDGVSLANRRFRAADGSTRCLGLWLQGVDGAGAPPPTAAYGRALAEAEINALLAAAGDDEEAFDRSLGPPGRIRPAFRLSHGTHVADLFAGYGDAPAAEAQQARERPMVVVSLPPAASADTSGIALVAPVLDAVVHIVRTVRPPNGPPPAVLPGGRGAPPIIINFSYGFMADIGYAMSDLAAALTGLMTAYNAAHPKAPLVIVTAAGNGFQSRTHARLPRQAADAWSLSLRILPDDRTPSHAVLRLPPGKRRYRLTLTAPGLPPVTVDPANRYAALKRPGEPPSAFLQFDPPTSARPAGLFTLTVNPTADPLRPASPPSLARHGVWRLTLSGPDTASPEPVHAFVARDETLPGEPLMGRQARFEDPGYRAHDAFGRPAASDEAASAVRRAGCINLLGVDPAGGVVSVAAGIAATGMPADYSAAGAPLGPGSPTDIRAPDAMADAEHSAIVSGVLAAGSRSGSVAAMGGTSVAAPLVARRIADALAAGAAAGGLASADAGRRIAFRLASGSTSQPPAMPADARKGAGRIAAAGRRTRELAALRAK